MSDYEFCVYLAEIAEREGISTALATAMDEGHSYDDAMFDLEYMGVIK